MGNMVMNMNEVKDLKDVLNRIEEKLIAAGKMYSALNFAVWEAIMVLYYILEGLFDLHGWETAIYWIVGFSIAMYFTIVVGKRLSNLEENRNDKNGKKCGIFIGISWGIGAFLGFGIVPAMNLGVNMEASFSMGLLSFIAISVFGMWLTYGYYGCSARETIPSFIIPAIGVPVVMGIKTGSVIIGVFFIAFGFTLTIIWYLYNAFRVIEG